MPWDETNRMDQRLRFVRDFSTCRYTMTELCERYGISRPTGYKWVTRWCEEGPSGLVDRSQAPHHCPHKTPRGVEEALLAARRAHPHWGPRKLLWVLRRPLAETGLYGSEQSILADAVRTLLAARPDLRLAIACRLYEKEADLRGS